MLTSIRLWFHVQLKKEVTGEMNSVDMTDEGSRDDSSISTSPSGLLNWHRALSNRYESTGPGEDSPLVRKQNSRFFVNLSSKKNQFSTLS